MKVNRMILSALLVLLSSTPALSMGKITGELKKWHKVTITFEGPETSETADPNPFLDYRLNVTFSHQESGKSYLVPGYYAADGNAAETSAYSGDQWRVHFAPDAVGEWRYSVSFRKGNQIAVNEDAAAGESAGFMDGETGAFSIQLTDKTGRDLRGKGLLQYVGKHHLQFAETGDYFLKCGADAPENLLAYEDFDGDFKTDGHKDQYIKTWEPHVKDWNPGDPSWQDGKGKGLIGAINYLASKGMNVFSFLTLNIAGDDQNVFPYINYDERLRMDVSRLAQWEIVFEHADKLGMYLHFKTSEAENQNLLDGGAVGTERKLYYRELIARFSHHLALNWNLGEENGKWGNHKGQTTEQRREMTEYFYDHDSYRHIVVIHNGQSFDDLLGTVSKLRGASVQTNRPDFSQVHGAVRGWIKKSVRAGVPWVVACDEPGDAQHALITDEEDPNHDNARVNALWGTLLAGGAGVEWYFGYAHPESDLTCQDWRSRNMMWDQCRYALQFFKAYRIPFWAMSSQDSSSSSGDWILASPFDADNFYAVVQSKDGSKSILNLPEKPLDYGWFNPHSGEGLTGLLHTGQIQGSQKTSLQAPDERDWILLIGPPQKLWPDLESSHIESSEKY